MSEELLSGQPDNSKLNLNGSEPIMATGGRSSTSPSENDPTRTKYGNRILQPDEVVIVKPEEQGPIETILSGGKSYRRALPGKGADGQAGKRNKKIK